MKLIVDTYNCHVSKDTIEEFEEVILQTPEVCAVENYSLLVYKIIYFLVRAFRKLKTNILPMVCFLYKQNPWKDSKHLFTIMMALDDMKMRPYLITSFHNKSIYLFDAWPKDYYKIQDYCIKYRINFLFVTASQSAQNLQTLLPSTNIYWMPEGITPKCYQFEDYSNKTIHVLALGRKYDMYHEQIVSVLIEKGYTYLYEQQKGQLVFPTHEDFIQGLGRTKISICFPSSVTHPDRAGDVETMTIRYLQSIVSKCLIVGHSPKEMIDLFGYNPVIEVDMSDPVGQIEIILKNFDTYIPFIEKNYQQVLQYHTWSNRWNQMIEIWSK
jgi:hypothetical protein